MTGQFQDGNRVFAGSEKGIYVYVFENKGDRGGPLAEYVLFWNAGVAGSVLHCQGETARIPFLISSLDNLFEFGTLRVLEEDKAPSREQKWEAPKPVHDGESHTPD